MNLIKTLTPVDTEEVKPGLFVQKRKSGWRQIEPLAWDGKMRWKAQIKTVFSFRTFIGIAIIIFIVWAYLHDVQEYKNFHEEVMTNPVGWCDEVYRMSTPGNIVDQKTLSSISNITLEEMEGLIGGSE